jgi:hypothetical protein
MSYVYLMKNMSNGYYKVGYSDRPEYRERTLQAQEPDIRLLATVDGTMELERQFHQDFSKHRVRGEWFAFSGLVLWSLAQVFGVSIETVDPPSQSSDLGGYFLNVHRYGKRRCSTRIIGKAGKRMIFEVPYAISASEALIEIEAEGKAWEIEMGWQDEHLRTAFRTILLEQYRVSDSMWVELLELRCLATSEPRGFYVDVHSYGGRFYPRKTEAQVWFNRKKKIFDAYIVEHEQTNQAADEQ